MQSIINGQGISRRQLIAAAAGLAIAAPFAGLVSKVQGTQVALADDSFRTLDEIKESGSVNIGVFTDKAPFGYVDADGKNQGYDVVFAQRLADDLGVTANYISTDASNRVPFLQSGQADIMLANFTVTDERAEKVDFTLPYMKVQLGVVSPDDALITSLDDLKGKTLIVSKGTTAETYFTENYPEVELQKYDTYADAYNALLDRRGDAFSTDNTEVLAWAKANEGFTVGIDAIGNVDTIAGAVAKGNTTLLDFINDEIVALADENFFHNDYEQTLEPVYGDDVDPEAIVVEGGVIDGEGDASDSADADTDSASDTAAAGTYKDGTYEATGKGIGGDVPVTVTIEGGKITSVEVGDNNETQGVGSKAIDQLPDEIVAANGTDGVDGVSGASVTSKAIFSAVNEILEEAAA